MMGLQKVKKFDDMFTHFDRIHEYTNVTDRRLASRGKNIYTVCLGKSM